MKNKMKVMNFRFSSLFSNCIISTVLLCLTIQKESMKQNVFMDLGFVVDSSASFKEHYNLEKQFVKQIAGHFDLGRYKTRTSLLTYSNYVNTLSKLSDFHTEKELSAVVNSAPFMGSISRLDKALAETEESMFTVNNGGRVGVQKVLVVLTDDYSESSKEAFLIGKRIRDQQNVHIIVVAVGRAISKGSLGNLGDQVFYIDHYSGLGSIELQIQLKNAITKQGNLTTMKVFLVFEFFINERKKCILLCYRYVY